MITSTKKFGSYVLTKNHLYDNEALQQSTESNDRGITTDCLHGCSIPSHWIELPLLAIVPYNHDTSIFRFALPTPAERLCLPVGGFLLVKIPLPDTDGSTPCIRPYTSITDETLERTKGYFELLCKRYDQWGMKETPSTHFLFTKTDHSYRPPGIASNFIHNLKIGDTLAFKRKTITVFQT